MFIYLFRINPEGSQEAYTASEDLITNVGVIDIVKDTDVSGDFIEVRTQFQLTDGLLNQISNLGSWMLKSSHAMEEISSFKQFVEQINSKQHQRAVSKKPKKASVSEQFKHIISKPHTIQSVVTSGNVTTIKIIH